MISSKQLALATLSLSDENKDAKVVLEKLNKFIDKHRLESFLPQILKEIKNESLKRKESRTLFVETPFEEDKEIMSKISGLISVTEDSELSHKVNKSILGGFRAYYKDKKYDASVDSALKRLAEELKAN